MFTQKNNITSLFECNCLADTHVRVCLQARGGWMRRNVVSQGCVTGLGEGGPLATVCPPFAI